MSNSSNKFCLIYYYVPEDKDDPEVPNAFGINIPQEEVRFSDIKQMFPLEGEYIFRFKYKYNSNNVWMDLPSDTTKLPLFNGKITMKATRISWDSKKDKTPTNADNIAPKKVESNVGNSQPINVQPQQTYSQQNIPQQTYSQQNIPQNQPQPTMKPNDYDLLGGGANNGGFNFPNKQSESFSNQMNNHGNLIDFDYTSDKKNSASNSNNQLNDVEF